MPLESHTPFRLGELELHKPHFPSTPNCWSPGCDQVGDGAPLNEIVKRGRLDPVPKRADWVRDALQQIPEKYRNGRDPAHYQRYLEQKEDSKAGVEKEIEELQKSRDELVRGEGEAEE